MRDYSSVYKLPEKPAVYAFYSGGRRPKYVVYVGIAGKLKGRIRQHLIGRDSSVATGTSAVSLNPDYVETMSWWEHESFSQTVNLKAAEMISFDILNPALRSRAGADSAGVNLLSDSQFKRNMQELFKGPPTGTIEFPSLSENSGGALFVQKSQVAVNFSRGLLDHPHRPDKGPPGTQSRDREIVHCTLGLPAIQCILRHLDFAKRIAFNSIVHFRLPPVENYTYIVELLDGLI